MANKIKMCFLFSAGTIEFSLRDSMNGDSPGQLMLKCDV